MSYPDPVRAFRLSRSGRVAVLLDGRWRVAGRVEALGSGWLALDALDRRLYGESGPLWPSRDDAAQALAETASPA